MINPLHPTTLKPWDDDIGADHTDFIDKSRRPELNPYKGGHVVWALGSQQCTIRNIVVYSFIYNMMNN